MKLFYVAILAIFAEIIFYNPLDNVMEDKTTQIIIKEAPIQKTIEDSIAKENHLKYCDSIALVTIATYRVENADKESFDELSLYEDNTFNLRYRADVLSTSIEIAVGTWKNIGGKLKLEIDKYDQSGCFHGVTFKSIDTRAFSKEELLDSNLVKMEKEYILVKKNSNRLEKISTSDGFFALESFALQN